MRKLALAGIAGMLIGVALAITAPPSGIKIVTLFSDGTKITGMVGVENI